ncbi:MAG: nascent polypeptide-associated complex protein [Candidatus Kariarchaeaceae archaeon]
MSKRRRDLRREKRNKQRGSPPGGAGMDGMSPKQMQKAMSQIDTQEIEDVVEVIVKTKTEEIVLLNPEVTIMNMGQELWNIVPQGTERRPLGSRPDAVDEEDLVEIEVKPEDVQLIVSTANVSEEEATDALKKSRGDLAAAIMSLK